jgi:hypothetical protein
VTHADLCSSFFAILADLVFLEPVVFGQQLVFLSLRSKVDCFD